MGAVPAAMIGDQDAARWPYQSHLELGAISSAVPSARLHARLVLWEWGLSADKAEAAELVVSELVTNALEHGSAGIPATVRIWISSDGGSVAINVWDASPRPPVPKNAGADADSGRGLMIVAAVSTNWGWSAADPGKVVWRSLMQKRAARSSRPTGTPVRSQDAVWVQLATMTQLPGSGWVTAMSGVRGER